MLSFDNIFISSNEDYHSKLKRALKTFINDMKKIIDDLKLLVNAKKMKYYIVRENAKIQISRNCDIIALQNLTNFINFYALKLIRKEINKRIRSQAASNSRFVFISLFLCIKIYETLMRLSCVHFIHRQAFKNDDDRIKMKNIHFH
jgi:hypothetical protein